MTEEQWSRAGWRNAEKHIDQLEAEIAMLRSQLRAADDAWIREAVRLMEQEANEYEQFAAPESSPRAKTLRAHIAKVKLEER